MHTITKHTRFLGGMVAALLLTAGAAHATTFVGTDSFTDLGSGSSNSVNFTGTSDSPINFTTSAGHSNTINDLMTITAKDSNVFSNSGTDNIEVNFNFTQPSDGNGNVQGSGTEDIAFFGLFDLASGNITWNNPGTITFADGAILNVTLTPVTMPTTFGTTDSVQIGATFKDVQDPKSTPVPEPMSLALLGTGIFGLGLVGRRPASKSA